MLTIVVTPGVAVMTPVVDRVMEVAALRTADVTTRVAAAAVDCVNGLPDA
ncbi:MAG: hypothetical protein MK171_00375 [Pirellulales bacterium]|nr:hypothetical protein [Pirellulales bacterium]